MDPWSPNQYLRFEEERRQPFFDLLALVEPCPSMRVVDLGCGVGSLTRILHERLQATETLGIDGSEAMLARARTLEGPGLRFEKEDIEHFEPPVPYDLVFSNAALHWLPDHRTLLPRLTLALAESGQLAVQVPTNHDHPASTVATEIAGEAPFREVLRGYVRPTYVLEPETYASLLVQLGYREQHVRLQVYSHPLESREEVVEWQKGALLTAYEQRMPPDLYDQFVERYRARLFERIEDTRPYVFLFKRVLFWARR